MTSHELNSFQLKKLTKQIEICKNSVPFYKDILIDVELPITSIEHFKDQIPFTTKDQIRRNHKYFLNDTLVKGDIFVSSTGGTMGEALKFYIQEVIVRTKEINNLYFL